MDGMICGKWARSYIPPACKDIDVYMGIDEAGRGPVLGSLVYCACFWPVSQHEEICSLGFDDSKVLKEEDREKLFEKIRKHPSIGWVIEELDAPTLSKEMLRVNPVSLNVISYNAVVRILEKIRDSKKPPVVITTYIDTVGDPEHYKSYLERAVGTDFTTFVIEKKADATYKTVSAASIIAKVTRDKLLSEWKGPIGTGSGLHGCTLDKNFGSGYPSDEVCVKWLERSTDNVFGFPDLVRFSWSTCRDMLIQKNCVTVKWACEDEDTGGADILDYFSAGGKSNKRPARRTEYFHKLKMKHVCKSDLTDKILI